MDLKMTEIFYFNKWDGENEQYTEPYFPLLVNTFKNKPER